VIDGAVDYGNLVNAENIPGDNIFPESVSTAATSYSTAGTAVTEKGAAVLTQWQGLGAVYTAPESAELLAVMDPVSVDTAAMGTTLSSVSGIIATFAETIAPIKTRLLALKEEAQTFASSVINGVTVDIWDKDHPAWDAGIFSFAVTDFADMGPATITWEQHQPSVDKNKDIIGRVNIEVAALDTAQADAVNAINALRTDTCLAEVVPLTADDLDAEGVTLPYGAATDGDKGCWQSTNDGIESAVVGMGEGAGALFGYNAATGEGGDGELAAQAWRGMGMTVAGVAMLGTWSMAATLIPNEHVPDFLKGVDEFSEEAVGYATNAGKELIALDMWSENPAEAFGTTLVNVGTFFIPGGAVVGGLKAGTVAARAASIAGHAADFVIPGLAVTSRAVTGAAVHAGSGLTAMTNALKGSLTSGVSVTRGALAQTLNSLGDTMPSVRVEPGTSVALPGGGSLPGPGRIVIGEPGSGGSLLHSIADRVDAGTTPATSGAPAAGTPGVSSAPASGTPGTSGATSGTPGAAETPGTSPGTSGSPTPASTPDAAALPGASGAGTTRPATGGAADGPADAPVTSANPAEQATDGTTPAAADAASGGAAGGARPAAGAPADAADTPATPVNPPASATDGTPPTAADATPADAMPVDPTPSAADAAPTAGGAVDAPADATVSAANPAAAAADGATPAGRPASTVTDPAVTDPAVTDPAVTDPAGTDGRPSGAAASQSSPVDLENGTTHTVALDNTYVSSRGDKSFFELLPDVLDAHGVTSAEYGHLVDTPIADLSRTEMRQLISISDALPFPDTADLLQKTIPYGAGENIVHQMGDALQEVSGFVARPIDGLGSTTQQIRDSLGLNYPDSPFEADLAAGRPFFDVRFDATGVNTSYVADSPLRWMEKHVPDSVLSIQDPAARATGIQQHLKSYDPVTLAQMEADYPSLVRDLPKALAAPADNPFRGNGFSGTGSNFAPEATFGGGSAKLPDGAELWRTLPDGTREFVAVYQREAPNVGGSWVLPDGMDPYAPLSAPSVAGATPGAP
jgi:hypothetical protein